MKQYTYKAPTEYLDTTGSDLKDVTTEYRGAPSIVVACHADTGLVIGFVSTGELPAPENTDTIVYYLLSEENPNQVILMDMLDGCKASIGAATKTETIHIFDNGYKIEYTQPVNQNALHTYELREVTISNTGVVTYPWKKPHISRETFELSLKDYINETTNKILQFGSPVLRAPYEKLLEILLWIKTNSNSISPWKINVPTIDDVR
jgi:hypothetical protein